MAAWCRRLRCSMEEDELVEIGFLRLGWPGFVGVERLFAESPGFGLNLGVVSVHCSVLGDVILCWPVSLV